MKEIFNDIENDGDNGQESPSGSQTDTPLEQVSKGSIKPENTKDADNVNPEDKIKAESSENSNSRVEPFAIKIYDPTHKDPDKPFESPLCRVGRILQNSGIPSAHRKQGLILRIGLESARMGNSIPIIISDEGNGTAVKILKACIGMTESNLIVWFTRMVPEALYESGQQLKDTCIVTSNLDGLKGGKLELISLIENDVVVNQQVCREDNKRYVKEIKAEGPISLVGISRNQKDELLNHPGVLRLHLSADDTSMKEQLKYLAEQKQYSRQQEFSRETNLVKILFSLAKPHPVEIPYQDQITDPSIWNIQNGLAKCKQFLCILNNVTRLHEMPDLSPDELLKAIVKPDYIDLARDLQQQLNRKSLPGGIDEQHHQHDGEQILVSTKRDYYFAWNLTKDILVTGDNHLNDRQIRVFNAIKARNMEALGSFVDTSSPKDILGAFRADTKTWAPIEDIKENLDADGGEKISVSTVRKEIKDLSKDSYVIRQKCPVSKNRDLFFVSTLSMDASVTLPHPRDIIDPEFEDRTIEVVNPITGEVETI